ncbi:MAG TPA: hypothetical protein ENI79_02755 [Rhodospirillales bacterium]|nr:hypothetical protein [Rhodospirillales bacterium]
MSKSPGFISAARHETPASKHIFRDAFNAFEGKVMDRNLVATYLPIRPEGGSLEGVFELYSDVSPLLGKINETTVKLGLGLPLLFAMLYAALFLIVRRADRILQRQYVDLEHEIGERRRAQEEIHKAREDLENRVEQRTRQLTFEISEHKNTERELINAKEKAVLANRAKSEFLATMSHELRTPLNAIIGFSQMMKDELFGPLKNDSYKGYATDIHASGEHLLGLIVDILDISAIETGQLEMLKEEVDLAKAATASIRLVYAQAKKGGVRLSSVIADDLPTLIAEERHIKQVLVNLLSNAVKFTPEGGSVTLDVRLDKGGAARFTITDTGIGMDETGIEIAFKPFSQVDSALSRKYEGSGLGLPLARGLVESLGGVLELESKPGVGTKVSVHLPPRAR